ncbi:MAG: pyridoxal phosphate-dependent aminotransferase, partial [Clostridia bacterium]|nr:pyridoxal phosphate-dependent aminotransferase [Clostridia bacterium]
MDYNFDELIDRRGTDSMKWNVPDNTIPMWVADMDFKTAPEIIDALSERVAHGIFGYTEIPDEWRRAYVGWWQRRHGFTMEAEWLIFATGVIPAISSTVRKLTTPNENVVIQTPVYNIFFNSIINNGARVLENPLRCNDGKFEMDLQDLEKKLADPQTTLMILCNPHNPVGCIWDRETLAAVAELAARYNVTVISDEIHCDLTIPGREYVPFASVSETARDVSITCLAPTKAFNIAGLQTAAVSVPNPLLRHKVWRALNTDEVAEPNAFACLAAIAAFEKGAPWLDALRGYLFENRQTVYSYFKANLPAVRVIESEATYVLWLDVSAVGNGDEVSEFLQSNAGVYLSAGSIFGGPGKNFLRLNTACPRATLLEGLERIASGIRQLQGE